MSKFATQNELLIMKKDINNAFSMIADYEGDVTKLFEESIEGEVPILATRNLVLFPGVVSPVLIGRVQSLNLINHLKDNQNSIFAIFCQKDADQDNPSKKRLV